MQLIIFFAMIFLHIVDDYYLQGCLSNMKQKSFWEEHHPEDMYKDDFLIALVLHAFSWTFSIHIPIMYLLLKNNYTGKQLMIFATLFIVNVVIHSIVDHFKANKKTINLTTDQLIHIGQIFVSFVTYLWIGII